MTFHTHPEWQALVRGICAYPDDDLRRLVAADWLREHEREREADFIQRQIAGEVADVTLIRLLELEPIIGFQPHQLSRRATKGEVVVSRRRGGPGAATMPTQPPMEFIYRRGCLDVVRAPLAWLIGGECENCGGTGLVDTYRYEQSAPCPDCGGCFEPTCDEFDRGYSAGTGRTPAHLDELVRTYPITRVVVTDREPRPNTAEEGAVEWWGWYVVGELMEQEEYDLPTELWPQLRHHRTSLAWDRDRPSRWCQFPTREAALDALSDALLNPARERAGLPALHPAATSAASAASAELL